MTIRSLLKSSALAAVAGAITMMALPAKAAPAERGGHVQREDGNPRGGWDRGERGGWNRGQAQQARPQQTFRQQAPAQVQQPPQQRTWQQQRQQGPQQVQRQQRDDWRANRAADAQNRQQWSGRTENRNQGTWQQQDRNRTYADPDRNRSYTDRDRNVRRDRRDDNRDYRRDYRQDNRYAYRNHNGYRQWDNDWRRDRRYDWNDYRRSHRDIFRVGRYYSPYYGYGYSRIGIGFYLDSLFYGQNYWISDPGYYRLPPVYGPYQWVRYYDDVLLVNIYTGEVVDVIYNFFW